MRCINTLLQESQHVMRSWKKRCYANASSDDRTRKILRWVPLRTASTPEEYLVRMAYQE
ncbi:MAG: hypothetical protein ACK56W_08125 [Pirellula sp.]